MALSHDSHEVVAEKSLQAHLGPRLTQHANLKIDDAFAQCSHVFVGLWREMQAHIRRHHGDRCHERCRENLHETLVGPDGEASLQGGSAIIPSLSQQIFPLRALQELKSLAGIARFTGGTEVCTVPCKVIR